MSYFSSVFDPVWRGEIILDFSLNAGALSNLNYFSLRTSPSSASFKRDILNVDETFDKYRINFLTCIVAEYKPNRRNFHKSM